MTREIHGQWRRDAPAGTVRLPHMSDGSIVLIFVLSAIFVAVLQ